MGNYSEASSNAPIPNPETAISGRILINYINIILDLAAAAFEVPDKNFIFYLQSLLNLHKLKFSNTLNTGVFWWQQVDPFCELGLLCYLRIN